MSPYRTTGSAKPTRVLRLCEPVRFGNLVAVFVILLVFGTFAYHDWSASQDNPMRWFSLCLPIGIGVALSTLALVYRHHHAWLVLMPGEERLRVVRASALAYSSATLRLRKPMTVEYSLAGKDAWLFIVAEDGRTARVLPATSALMASNVLERVEAALAAALETRTD